METGGGCDEFGAGGIEDDGVEEIRRMKRVVTISGHSPSSQHQLTHTQVTAAGVRSQPQLSHRK